MRIRNHLLLLLRVALTYLNRTACQWGAVSVTQCCYSTVVLDSSVGAVLFSWCDLLMVFMCTRKEEGCRGCREAYDTGELSVGQARESQRTGESK